MKTSLGSTISVQVLFIGNLFKTQNIPNLETLVDILQMNYALCID